MSRHGLTGPSSLLAQANSSHALQAALAGAMLKIDQSNKDFQNLLEGTKPYFKEWYDDQCRHYAEAVSAKSHEDLLAVIEYLQEPGATISSVRSKLRLTLQRNVSIDDSLLDGSIILALRVSCALKIGKIPGSQETFVPGHMVPRPELNEPIKDHIHNIPRGFGASSGQISVNVILPRMFNAKKLEEVAGLQLRRISSN